MANEQFFSQKHLQSGASEYNAMVFTISQLINKINTMALVMVTKVSNNGGVSPVGYVSVQLLVNQLTGDGKGIPAGLLSNIPYLRMQGGSNAIILDPQVGDIGVCGFCSRDISAVKESKNVSNPGSRRKYDKADGLYFGGFLNGSPTQYVQFNSDGITIHSPTAVKLTAPDVQITSQTLEVNASSSATITTPTFTINGQTVLNGSLSAGGTGGASATFSGSVSATGDGTFAGTSVHAHAHSGVTTGSGNTGAPN